MKQQRITMILVLALSLGSTGIASALPAQLEPEQLTDMSDLVVSGEVSDAECLSVSFNNEATITTYQATLQVNETFKGEGWDSVWLSFAIVEGGDIAGCATSYSHPVGQKGKYYLTSNDDGTFEQAYWNGFEEAADSDPQPLPQCSGELPWPDVIQGDTSEEGDTIGGDTAVSDDTSEEGDTAANADTSEEGDASEEGDTAANADTSEEGDASEEDDTTANADTSTESDAGSSETDTTTPPQGETPKETSDPTEAASTESADDGGCSVAGSNATNGLALLLLFAALTLLARRRSLEVS